MAILDKSKDTSWVATDHRDTDLREFDARGKVLYACDVRGAALYGVGVSLNCDTFDGLKLDDDQVAMLLRVFMLADINPAWRDGVQALVISIIGAERNKLLSRYLQIHA